MRKGDRTIASFDSIGLLQAKNIARKPPNAVYKWGLGKFVEARKHSDPADIVTDRDLGRNFPLSMNRRLQRARNRQTNEPLNSRKRFASQDRRTVEVLTTFACR